MVQLGTETGGSCWPHMWQLLLPASILLKSDIEAVGAALFRRHLLACGSCASWRGRILQASMPAPSPSSPTHTPTHCSALCGNDPRGPCV